MYERDGIIDGRLEYATDLFDASTIRRMIDHFQTVLSAIVTNPDTPIDLLPLLTQTENRQIVVEWNDTVADYPSDKTIHQLFEEQAERTPDSIALIFQDDHLTYNQLNQRTNRLAHYLIKMGVGPDVFVGIYMERSIEMVIGLLGILKAGGIYVPLDPINPRERIIQAMEDVKIKVVLTLQNRLSLAMGKTVTLDLETDWHLIQKESSQIPNVSLPADAAAYLIFTSGSTGQPKGILGYHRGVVNYLTYLVNTYNISESDVVLQLPPLNFDASIRDLVGPLTAGAKVVVVNQDVIKNPPALTRKINEHRVTCLLSAVPSVIPINSV